MSYTGADEPWAGWIAATLRGAGHDVNVQATDFLPGENFVLRMQEAATAADHTIVVLSNRYLASGFGASEWAAAFATDPTGARRAVIPVAIEPVSPPGLWRAIIRVELFGKSEAEAKQTLLTAVTPAAPRHFPFPPEAGAGAGAANNAPKAVEVWRLPPSDGLLVGRTDELAALDLAWSGTTNLVTIVGWGGSGKTALLNHWLAALAARQYDGAARVFAWSFDSQATVGHVAVGQINTADQFIDAALGFFGAEGPPSPSVWERCRELTTLVQQERALLILDGLDRLQEPPGRAGGTLREPAMKLLIRELAAYNTGLCVVTTRLAVADIQPFLGHTTSTVPLGSLSVDDASRLLVEEGVVGEAAAIEETATEAQCHPLTLRLLGSFIRTVYRGELRRWRASGLADALEQAGDGAGRLMDEYGAWFAGRPEAQILTAIGLFDRPATAAELRTLRAAPVVAGLNDLLVDLTEVRWAYAVSNLVDSGLVAVRPGDDQSLEAHPLVRGHFGATLRARSADAYREGHRRLCAYLSELAPPKPTTLAESLPLLSAVWHGTQAGEAARMLDELYWPRLAQDCHQLRDVLGAASANHEVLSYLVAAADVPGAHGAADALPPVELARILCDQALDLRMLGRPHDAVVPLRRAAEVAEEAGDDAVVANVLRHLAQLHLTLGQFAQARPAAVAATERVTRLPDTHLEQVATRLTLADVESHLGHADAAKSIVDSVLPMLRGELAERHAHRTTLYFMAFRAVQIAASAAEEPDPELAGIAAGLAALNERERALALPRALMRLASALLETRSNTLRPATTVAIDTALDEIRASGQRPWLVQALLIRATLFRTLGAFETAATSIREAKALSVSDGMATRQLDCDLEAARTEIASGNHWQGQLMLDSLAAVAQRLGYGRLHRQLTS